MSFPETTDPTFDLLKLVDKVRPVTADGPLGAPLNGGVPGQHNSYAWIYADPDKEAVSVVELAVVEANRYRKVVAGSLHEARLDDDLNVVVRAGGCLGLWHSGELQEPALFDVVSEHAREYPSVPDQAAFDRLQVIAAQVISFNMSDATPK
jgi:hypothetical protein